MPPSTRKSWTGICWKVRKMGWLISSVPWGLSLWKGVSIVFLYVFDSSWIYDAVRLTGRSMGRYIGPHQWSNTWRQEIVYTNIFCGRTARYVRNLVGFEDLAHELHRSLKVIDEYHHNCKDGLSIWEYNFVIAIASSYKIILEHIQYLRAPTLIPSTIWMRNVSFLKSARSLKSFRSRWNLGVACPHPRMIRYRYPSGSGILGETEKAKEDALKSSKNRKVPCLHQILPIWSAKLC